MHLAITCLIYIISTSIIGYYYSRKVNTVAGYAIAGKSLPMYITSATVFATWFGSESILGIPASYMEHGIVGIMSDPIGAFVCLIVIALFLGKIFYNLNVNTLADYLRKRYSQKAEVLFGFCISVSYLGWIAAQFIAFGLVLHFLSMGHISETMSKVIGAAVVLLITYRGGWMSVAITDFVQTIMIIGGLLYTLFIITSDGHTVQGIVQYAIEHDKFDWKYNADYPHLWSVVGVVMAMILGTIPQQDTFQRITSARSVNTAVYGTIIGAFIYVTVTFVPIMIVLYGTQVGFQSPHNDLELFIMEFIKAKTPFVVQVAFFGALMAAILSTISGTTLAASVVFSENVVGGLTKYSKNIQSMRLCVVLCTLVVLMISLVTTSSIHSLVEDAGKITMVGVFCPLIFGLFWKRVSSLAALTSGISGLVTWGGMSLLQGLVHDYQRTSELYGFSVSLIVIIVMTLRYPHKDKCADSE